MSGRLWQRLAVSGAIHAQTAGANSAAGRLGQRYIGTSYGVADLNDIREEFHDFSFGVNLPVSKFADFDAGYGYQWLNNNPVDIDAHEIDAGITLYSNKHTPKPFVSATVGYSWQKASYAGVTARDDEAFYGLSVGIEAPVGPVVLTPSIGLSDSLENGGDPAFGYGVDVHRWITSKLGLRAAISYVDHGDDLESWNYRLGLRVRF